MDIRGSRTLDAPRAAVFAALLDPGTLLAVIPGCREIEQAADGAYRGRIALRLPGVVGTYRTLVRVVEAEAPDHARLEGEVEGALGTIKGQVSFQLTETDAGAHAATSVGYDGHAAIGGPLARLDDRFVEGLAGSLIDQGLDTLNARLQGEASTDGSAALDQGVPGVSA